MFQALLRFAGRTGAVADRAAAGSAKAARTGTAASRAVGAGSRLGDVGFATQTWSGLFGNWMPSSTWATEVTVIGAKPTPNKHVTHAALSIAMGVLKGKGVNFTDFVLHVTADPIRNACKVSYVTQSMWGFANINFIIAALAAGGRLIKEAIKRGFNDEYPLLGGIIESQVGGWLVLDGIVNRKENNADDPPQQGDKKAVSWDILFNELSKFAAQFSPRAAYDVGAEQVIGGRIPFSLDPNTAIIPAELANQLVGTPQPFRNMIDDIWLTRAAAANPQPPRIVDGQDLRTLVAQAIHDPGIRPPLPTTDKGPPTIKDELKGE